MAFRLEQFVALRPYLYHLTAAGNVGRVRSSRCLESATALRNQSGRPDQADQRRDGHDVIDIGGVTVSLRDQSPLHEGNIEFESGWTFPRIIALLNQRVFFWPGTAAGPIDYGMRHYKRYEFENPAVLRVRTDNLFRTNPTNAPQFCRYNSGSPRWSGGVPSPRGATTFQTASANGYTPGQVVEVTFIDTARLPDDAELRGKNWSEWGPLF